MKQSAPLLEVNDLCVCFGKTVAVDHLSFTLAHGTTLGIVGESGSGKSVTALSILRLLERSGAEVNGTLCYDGQEIAQMDESALQRLRGHKISMIFQEPMTALNPLHCVGKQLLEAIALHQPQLSKAEKYAKCSALLENVELSDQATRLGDYPHQFSGGQRQRLMIAMALANDPQLLIADEPTTALDVTVQREIIHLLLQLQQKRQMSMLFISHDIALVRHVADEMLVMRHGKRVEYGPVEQLFSQPKHAYTKKLLASAPSGKPVHTKQAAPLLLCGKNVTVRYPQTRGFLGKILRWFTAVEQVSFTLKQGHTLGIVGESGSGKTSLIKALLRLTEASGNIQLNGQELLGLGPRAMRPVRAHMQVVLQDPYASLNPRLNVCDAIMEGMIAHNIGRNRTEREAHIATLLEEVGLDASFMHRYPHALSGGQRQRICIARALAVNPRLLILDEPTSALDATSQAEMLQLLKNLQTERGLSYVFISHDLHVVRTIAHEVMVLRHGKIMEMGPTNVLFNSPTHEYTKNLLASLF